MSIISKITNWITTPYTIFLILKDPSMSRSVKLRSIIGLILILAYMVSPIDIVPDFIPMSGWLDDLVVAPLGLALMRKFIPDVSVMERKERAQENVKQILFWTILSITIAIILGLIWLGILIYFVVKIMQG